MPATSEIRVRQETTSATAADHHHVKRQGDDGLGRRTDKVGSVASPLQRQSFCHRGGPGLPRLTSGQNAAGSVTNVQLDATVDEIADS
jgi:hypothetical protein